MRFVHLNALMKKLCLAMLVFSLCRLLFYLLNLSYFPNISSSLFFYGLRFDLSATAILYSPVILLHILPLTVRSARWYQAIIRWMYLIISSFCVLLNCIDFEYFKFTLKRATSDLFTMISLGDDFFQLIPAFVSDFWYVILLFILLIILIIYLYKFTFPPKVIQKKTGFKYYLLNSIIMIVVAFATVYAFRGGFQLRPINIISASQYSDARFIPVTLNTPFTVIKTINRSITEVNYMPDEEIASLFDPVIRLQPDQPQKQLNVVVIIMESLSKEYIGALSNKESFTPFLDSLIKESYVFDRCFANGKESMKGIPSVLASLPSFMNTPFITSAYSADRINSIASLLKEKNYSTHFFHGGTNGTLAFDGFTRSAGFDHYYGRDEYNNDEDYDGHWGIYDEPFFQFFAQKLATVERPFVASIFSLSSHHPFELPEKYKDKFTQGSSPYQAVIQYADLALKNFFKTASGMSWFNNTLFVITADHTGGAISSEYQSSVGNFAIPAIYYLPGSDLQGVDHRITQQCDILPGILQLIRFKGSFIAFGTKPFSDEKEGFSVSYTNNVYQIIYQNYILQFNGKEEIAFYNYISDPLLHKNMVGKFPYIEEDILKLLKAYIQSYNHRLIHNQMTVQ